jgi:dTDP-glucose 4,6-dehydratase
MGSHFLDLVHQDSHYEIRCFEGDVTNIEDVVRNLRDVDTVIHFAALTYVPPSWDSPLAYMGVNFGGTLNLLENHLMFSKFLYISTSHTYGNQESFPIRLDTVRLPNDPYSISKRAADDAVRLYSSRFGFKSLVIRPFNNFGPRQSKNFLVPTIIRQALNDGKISIKGNAQREFIYVKDNVRAIKGFLDKGLTGSVHVCKGEAYYITQMAEWVLDAVGLPNGKVAVLETDRPYEIDKLQGDPSSLYEALPDFKFTPMEQAIAETVEYYRNEKA